MICIAIEFCDVFVSSVTKKKDAYKHGNRIITNPLTKEMWCGIVILVH